MRDSHFDYRFCDFAFSSAQNDRMTAVLRRVKVFRSEYPTERLYGDIYIRFRLMLYRLVLD